MTCKLFNLTIPIIQAPMAGIATPELVAAVSNAGALGSLGAGYMQPDQIRSSIKKIKSLTNKPFSVNLFIPEESPPSQDTSHMKEFLTHIWKEISDAPFEVPNVSLPSFDEQVNVLLEEKIPVFSFTFGVPPISTIERFKSQGTIVYGTATTPEEALLLEKTGVDAIVCQGQEAGGHRGSFSSYDPFYSLSPLLQLTRETVKTPLIAAGGIMNGAAAASTFLLGASLVQLGTAFLTTTESGAHPLYKQTLLTKLELPTTFTKTFTGKTARGIINLLMEKLSHHAIPPYPVQHFLTHQLRLLAAEKNRSDLMSLWAGQGYPLCKSLSASDLIKDISKDL